MFVTLLIINLNVLNFGKTSFLLKNKSFFLKTSINISYDYVKMAESAPNLDENSTDNGVLTDMELSNSPVRSASPNLTNFEIPVLIANGSEFNGFDLPSASQQVPYFGDRNHLSFGMVIANIFNAKKLLIKILKISTPMAMLNHFQSIFDPGSSISNQNLEQQQIVAGTTVLIMLQNG